MAAVDPYAPCPCGSGQKFKWCCQKVEPFADRADRLYESGQVEAALATIEEGLRKNRANSWLLTRKAVYQIQAGDIVQAADTLRQVLARQPGHLGAGILLAQLELETEGAAAGAARLQQLLTAAPVDRPALGELARIVGTILAQSHAVQAALQHFKLAERLAPELADQIGRTTRGLLTSPAIAIWQKADYPLAPAPDALPADARQRFNEALRWAEDGLWSSATAAFETLSADPAANPAADRNAGLCRLWIGDDAGASEALERAVRRMGQTEEAVDLESLRQLSATPAPDDLVEHAQLIWPLRDRQALLDALAADPAVTPEGAGPIDPEDPNAPEADQFSLLDRPMPAPRPDLTIDEVPVVAGHVHVGQEIAVLEAFDDGRLDGLVDRFRTLAGAAIAPAHPRTKVLGRTTRSELALARTSQPPDGTEPETARRLSLEQGARIAEEVWPRTPSTALHGRSPLQAAEAGGFEVPLRAAVRLLEATPGSWRDSADFRKLRERLRIAPEPAIDPETVNIETLHPSRLALVPLDGLSDEKLAALYRQARAFGLVDVTEPAARRLAERPDLWERSGLTPLMIFSDLAGAAAGRAAIDEALDWIRRGRQADSGPQRQANALSWDTLEIQSKALLLPPEQWVPDLAVALQRYEGQPPAIAQLLSTMIELGLVHAQPNPDDPGQIMLDTRVLQAVMARYGPRVTTAGGALGIAATRGGLWTPGAAAPSGGGAIWTPGAEAAPAPPGPSKLIIPGR